MGSRFSKAKEEKKSKTFVINGFYMSMREKYTKPGSSLYYYVVSWDADKLSWEDFRGKCLGATDPAESAEGSVRQGIAANWESLELKGACSIGDNGMHGSASPFEAMAERMNWLGTSMEEDIFGKQLLAMGIPAETLALWTKDPQVDLGEGKKGSFFDAVEDMNTAECAARCCEIAGVEAKTAAATQNSAFLFIKPHAVTEKTKAFVAEALAKAGLTVSTEGELKAEVIEEKKLIDNHYYAIANKASLTKPADLNPPAAKLEVFAKTFGIEWSKALEDGLVFNALDGCKHLNIDGDEMNTIWAAAKKAKKLVKFGGGFYAGKVQGA